MALLLEGTTTITEDELALGLRETIRPSPDFKSRHRYQVIFVVRGEKVVEWMHDMGPETNFKTDQFNIVGGTKLPDGGISVWANVGYLREVADQIRRDGFESERRYGKEPRQDLVQAYLEELDMKNRALVGRKVFGLGSAA